MFVVSAELLKSSIDSAILLVLRSTVGGAILPLALAILVMLILLIMLL